MLAMLQPWHAATCRSLHIRGVMDHLGRVFARRRHTNLSLQVLASWAELICFRHTKEGARLDPSLFGVPAHGQIAPDIQDSSGRGLAIASVLSRQLECLMCRECLAGWQAVAAKHRLRAALTRALLRHRIDDKLPSMSVSQLHQTVDGVFSPRGTEQG